MNYQSDYWGIPWRAGRFAQTENDSPQMAKHNEIIQYLGRITLQGVEDVYGMVIVQIVPFLELCDIYDIVVLQQNGPMMQMVRLTYIARLLGYDRFCLSIIGSISKKDLKKYIFSNETTREAHKKWLQDFYADMLEGSQKSKLKARMAEMFITLP